MSTKEWRDAFYYVFQIPKLLFYELRHQKIYPREQPMMYDVVNFSLHAQKLRRRTYLYLIRPLSYLGKVALP